MFYRRYRTQAHLVFHDRLSDVLKRRTPVFWTKEEVYARTYLQSITLAWKCLPHVSIIANNNRSNTNRLIKIATIISNQEFFSEPQESFRILCVSFLTTAKLH